MTIKKENNNFGISLHPNIPVFPSF